MEFTKGLPEIIISVLQKEITKKCLLILTTKQESIMRAGTDRWMSTVILTESDGGANSDYARRKPKWYFLADCKNVAPTDYLAIHELIV